MADRNGQRGSTCFSSQMEDNTSNNGPRPFSATTTTTTAAEYCQHQRRSQLFGLCGLTWNYRVCFREGSCHDKVLGRPIHTYTHTIRGEYPEEHTHLSTAHTERVETLETIWKYNSRKLCFIQREKKACFVSLVCISLSKYFIGFTYNIAKASIHRLLLKDCSDTAPSKFRLREQTWVIAVQF